ncbi:glycosyltransferase [uncultured Alistipes sp.]|uniref:glycosyltransferase n=1 Tax=uncultured Alistipes sp. TaxID=538949 RepID=UPI00260916EB|nr:glycosyltransferase [uncultured Alistipes sp.]
MEKKKIAFIIIRYGVAVNGGAEAHCRMLAERLTPFYDVEVLTTTTRIFGDPEADFAEGESVENGVTVRRFRPHPIDGERHRQLGRQCRTALRVRRHLDQLHLLGAVSSLHPVWRMSTEAERRFFLSQPDHTPAMLRFIEQYQEEYAALLFMNFYFSQTVLGSVIAPQKTILIPLVHPDKNLYWALNAPMFTRVRHIAFNTEAERHAARRIFGTSLAPNSLVGCGIEQTTAADWDQVRARYHLPERYVLYLGRVTPSKLNDLIPCFLDYCRRYGSDTKLVLTGGIDPQAGEETHPEILRTGFVCDAEKAAIIRHATVMVNPSHLESLSLLMLEAMNSRIPVLVNGRSRVMKEHCRLSGAALWYDNKREFLRHLHRLLTDEAFRTELGSRGPAYVREHYAWERIIPALRHLIEAI